MIENRGVLGSDVWGAACEAVYPAVAQLNWNQRNKLALASSLRRLNEIQHRYFEQYFQMPARCPLSTQRYIEAGARMIKGKWEASLVGERLKDFGAVTDECAKVTTLAGFVDHAFHAHGNSREEIAQMVEIYENSRAGAQIALDLSHYQSSQLRSKIARQQVLAARQRERQRMAKRRIFAIH